MEPKEQVNHPAHYNSHPAGIECIDVIRHYTCDIANALKYLWRAGLKAEMGKEDAEKEIEDLKKALWYIEDYRKPVHHHVAEAKSELIDNYIKRLMGHSVVEIVTGYPESVSQAMQMLLRMGLSVNGMTYAAYGWERRIDNIRDCIGQRIYDIDAAMIDKEFQDTCAVLHGQLVDGEDYVSKPGCVRETEPEQYDPLNMIVAWGRVYSLTGEVRKKDNGALFTPCESCSLMDVCYEDWQHPETSARHDICRLHDAQTNEYYSEVGVAKYSPRFGTVEVVDQVKESELRLKRLQQEEGL